MARAARKTAAPGTVVLNGLDVEVSVNDPFGGDPTVYKSGDGVTVPAEHVGAVLAHNPGAVVASDESSAPAEGGTPS